MALRKSNVPQKNLQPQAQYDYVLLNLIDIEKLI